MCRRRLAQCQGTPKPALTVLAQASTLALASVLALALALAPTLALATTLVPRLSYCVTVRSSLVIARPRSTATLEQVGVIESYDSSAERYTVKLSDGTKLALRQACLLQMLQVCVARLHPAEPPLAQFNPHPHPHPSPSPNHQPHLPPYAILAPAPALTLARCASRASRVSWPRATGRQARSSTTSLTPTHMASSCRRCVTAAHALHMHCTCTAHALHMHCTCTAHAALELQA